MSWRTPQEVVNLMNTKCIVNLEAHRVVISVDSIDYCNASLQLYITVVVVVSFVVDLVYIVILPVLYHLPDEPQPPQRRRGRVPLPPSLRELRRTGEDSDGDDARAESRLVGYAVVEERRRDRELPVYPGLPRESHGRLHVLRVGHLVRDAREAPDQDRVQLDVRHGVPVLGVRYPGFDVAVLVLLPGGIARQVGELGLALAVVVRLEVVNPPEHQVLHPLLLNRLEREVRYVPGAQADGVQPQQLRVAVVGPEDVGQEALCVGVTKHRRRRGWVDRIGQVVVHVGDRGAAVVGEVRVAIGYVVGARCHVQGQDDTDAQEASHSRHPQAQRVIPKQHDRVEVDVQQLPAHATVPRPRAGYAVEHPVVAQPERPGYPPHEGVASVLHVPSVPGGGGDGRVARPPRQPADAVGPGPDSRRCHVDP
mmetsp:Transcript_29250/g.66667  ORF Transcript_29250/g.66667 Transcript_29250/m.66667 type:complete len:423 (+) Transcript_29250:381-1649(+)